MLKSLKRFFLCGATLILGASMFAGCSSAMTKASESLGAEAVAAMNRSAVVQEVTDASFSDFSFLAADFNRADESNMDIDVSGVAKYNEGKDAYVTLSYTVSDDHFAGVSQDKKAEVIDAITQMVANEEMNEFDMVPISSVKALNKTLKTISESPLDDYNFQKGMAFSVSNVQFNEEEGYASFRLRSHNDYLKIDRRFEPGLVYNGETWEMGMVWNTYYYNEDFIHTNDIYVRASAEDLELMKLDHSFIIDNFVNYVNNGEKEKYVVNSVAVDKVSDYDVSMSHEVDMENL